MSEEKIQAVTYNLADVVANPADNSPMTIGKKPMTVRDAIVTSFKMPVEKDKQLSEGDLNFRRIVVLKLERATELSTVALKSKAVQLIKDQVRAYYAPGVSMQIYGVFDGEPTAAEMDAV